MAEPLVRHGVLPFFADKRELCSKGVNEHEEGILGGGVQIDCGRRSSSNLTPTTLRGQLATARPTKGRWRPRAPAPSATSASLKVCRLDGKALRSSEAKLAKTHGRRSALRRKIGRELGHLQGLPDIPRYRPGIY